MKMLYDDMKDSPLSYFIAGAVLPTLAYAFLLRRGNQRKNDASMLHEDDDYSSSEDEFESIQMQSNGDDPKSWGLTDQPYKMLLIVNTSLGMGKGKIAAQCSHAAVGCYKKASKQCPGGLRAWEITGCAKIAVKCPSEEEMTGEILKQAAQKGIPYYVVEDAGRTQIAAGSRTVLGLGPAPVRLFDSITSHLKLM